MLEASPTPGLCSFNIVKITITTICVTFQCLRKLMRYYLATGWLPIFIFIGGHYMLILSRKPTENIIINDNIVITVLGVKGHNVRLGISAPRDITVHREEIYEKIMARRLTEIKSETEINSAINMVFSATANIGVNGQRHGL
jgi:carbon storage regulator